MSQDKTGEKLIATNPNARHQYYLEEIVEAGIALTGTEIKSLRDGSPNLRDAFVEVTSRNECFEAWLSNAHIAPYKHGNIWNHDPLRKRKLLLHHHQLKQMYAAITQKGMTIVPTRMYFKKGRAKIEIALGKGKKLHDKRDTLRKRSEDREMSRALKKSKRD